MAKIERTSTHPAVPEYIFDCPGCGQGHWFKTAGDRPVWKWNGSVDKPTLTPSVLVESKAKDGTVLKRCHFYMTNGYLIFLADCTHAVAGKTVTMKDIED